MKSNLPSRASAFLCLPTSEVKDSNEISPVGQNERRLVCSHTQRFSQQRGNICDTSKIYAVQFLKFLFAVTLLLPCSARVSKLKVKHFDSF